MEKLGKADLLRMIEGQKDKLSRYESRLKDVVAAYKSLSKEKEALEASLRALSPLEAFSADHGDASNLSNGKLSGNEKERALMQKPQEVEDEKKPTPSESSSENIIKASPNEKLVKSSVADGVDDSTIEQLRIQLATLTNSLSTLSAEKSRMEAGFQADKRKLRSEKEELENVNRDLQRQSKQQERQYKSEIEALKSKLIVERHEREKEHNDHGAMIMELQKLLTEERNARGQLEATITPLKSRAVTSDQTEKLLRDAKNELEMMKNRLRESEATAQEASPILLQLQREMAQLKQQHTVAIQEEQTRAIKAEERARQLVALHEERVASLESRLAELSETVGSYDRLRHSDQIAIQNLKDHIAQMSTLSPSTDNKTEKDESCVEVDPSLKVQSLLIQLSKLKDEILEANQLSEKPIDIEDALFFHLKDFGNSRPDLHVGCREEKNRLAQELDQIKSTKSHAVLYQTRNREGAETETLKFQIRSLQERVRMLNCQLEQMESTEQELKAQAKQYQQQLETEKAAWQEKIHMLECELRAKAMQTEQQLALQREHSLALLEDKEQEIRTLKSSFQMFLPHGSSSSALSGLPHSREPLFPSSDSNDHASPPKSSSDDNLQGTLSGILLSTLHSASAVPGGSSESPHILHYAHELARREVDISNSRKTRNKLENDLRDMSKILASERERHSEETLRLRESVARLERCQSREGANLEYLKNVVISLLESDNPSSKHHMLNAIAAVLRFSEEEMNRVTRHSSNSWWYNAQ